MKEMEFLATMKDLVDAAPRRRLGPGARYVFLSDLHLGDRGPRDEFRHNADLLIDSLSSRYLAEGWTLVLNGDIEELYKYRLAAVREAYRDLYGLFAAFRDEGRLVKIVGNHDLALMAHEEDEFPVEQALRLDGGQGTILAFHGHQSSDLFMRYNYLSDFLVRYLADPLAIRNADMPMTSKRRFKAERRIYRASKELGLVTVAGHTHRPLFESFSKYDSLRWTIETLLRRYADEDAEARERSARLIAVYSDEFRRLSKKEKKRKVSRSLYEREELLVPCMFNSGCATGKGGYTALEIEGEAIALAYWTRAGGARPYIERESLSREALPGTGWVRYTVARDSLEYLMARVRLLS